MLQYTWSTNKNQINRAGNSLCSWWDSCARGTFLALESPRKVSSKAAKVNLPCHISYKFWMPPTFVTLIGTIWLLNQKKWWNTKLTCKCGRPSITVKSWTRQLHVASYSGSRQGILQLLETWETKTWSFSHNKKLHASKEVKKFPKLLQRSNSVRDKIHNYEINTQETHQLMISQSAKVTFAQSKPRILHILLPLFESASFKWSSTLLMLSSDGSGSLHCMTKGNVVWCAFVIEPVSCLKTRLVLALSEYKRIAEDMP